MNNLRLSPSALLCLIIATFIIYAYSPAASAQIF